MEPDDCYHRLEFLYHPAVRDEFQSGKLVTLWSSRYPDIFDGQDLRLARSQPGYHFYEWLAAVLMYESTGYVSLIEKYDCPNLHPRKVAVFERIVGPELADWLFDDSTGKPDLFIYDPCATSDWFFCEVKGGPDRLRPIQCDVAKRLHERTRKRVRLLSLHAVR